MRVKLFFGLNPALLMRLKNSKSPIIDTIKNNPATLYLLHIIAATNMQTNKVPVVVLLKSSFKIVDCYT